MSTVSAPPVYTCPWFSPMERLWERIELTESNCWQWTGYVTGPGYAQLQIQGKKKFAHRVAYELYRGSVPKKLQLHHTCENRLCINPWHLEVLTAIEHVRFHRWTPTCRVCGSERKVMVTRKDGRPAGSRCMDCANRRKREKKQRELSYV